MTIEKETKLIEKFKKLEAQLVELLKIEPLDIDSTTQGAKTKIKSYIKKVSKAREIFDEYEKTAEEIEKLTAKNVENVVSAVVDFRESLVDDKNADEFVDELIVGSEGAKKIKKKKPKAISKEF